MRSDMAKVVTERPRSGSRNRSKKFGGRLSADEISSAIETDDAGRAGFIPWCRRRNSYPKEFSDLIGPLRKYLRKQVGRSWDSVYSEMSKHLDRRTLAGRHIWTHVFQEIVVNCYVGVSGRIWKQGRYGAGHIEVHGLYVHPFTGLICHTGQDVSWTKRGRRSQSKKDGDTVLLDGSDGKVGPMLKRIDGIWYHVMYDRVARLIPARRIPGYFTVPVRHISKPHYVEAKDIVEEIRMIQKRQLNHNELRDYKLNNNNI